MAKRLETTDDVVVGKINKMAALENILDEIFVCRFLIEEKNSYEELLAVIKNRYPNLRGFSLRSVKRFCSYHGVRRGFRLRMKQSISQYKVPYRR